MPKADNPKLIIHLDLLKPQSNPEKIITKLLRWVLSSGRYIFIFVEALVLIAFIARFKLDADLAKNRELIEEQIPYIESLKPYEILIKQTQLKLSTIGSFRSNYTDYPQILKKISDQTPQGVKLNSLNVKIEKSNITIQMSAQAQSNNDLATFIGGLKEDSSFSDINISSISFEKGIINFTLNGLASLSNKGENP